MKNYNVELSVCCPYCKSDISMVANKMFCNTCNTDFNIDYNIPSFLTDSSNKDLKQKYEEMAADGDGTANVVGYVSEKHHRNMIMAFQHLFEEKFDSKLILDIGCGHGQFSKIWSNKNRVVGIDLSSNMLKMAKDNGLDVYQADAKQIPFCDSQFDCIICAEVIQHFSDKDLDHVLMEMYRLLKPGGLLAISTLNSMSIVRNIYRTIKKILPILKIGHGFMPFMRNRYSFVKKLIEISFVHSKTNLVYYPSNYISISVKPNPMNLLLATNFVELFKKPNC